MFSVRAWQAVLLAAALTAAPAFAIRAHRPATSGHHARSHHHSRHSSRARHHKVRGQRGIDSARATEIQKALIKQNYLSGAPSGQWDQATEDAMRKYQADHGWQTKLTPDSRALIALGLGPDHDGTPVIARRNASAEPASPAANTLASTHIIQD
jgi:hypothetical protein